MKTKLSFLTLVIILGFSSITISQWINYTPSVSLTRNLTSVYFSSSNTGWITGDSGLVYKTTNGGNNWFSQGISIGYTLWCVHAVNDSTVWVCGDAGRIYKSVNGGINWVQQTSPAAEYLYKIRFTDAMNGWIVTSGSKILNTSNGGTNWVVNFVTATGGEINALYAPSSDTILTGGQAGVVHRTTNHGVNWTFSQPSTNWHTNMVFANKSTGWICSRSGGILKTTNAGVNWTAQSSGTTQQLNTIFFVDAMTGYVAGVQGIIRKTVNGGTNWYNNATISGSFYFYTLFFHNALTGWGVGSTGTMMRTTSGGLVFSGNQGNEVPEKYALHNNYPNPFNPSTRIKFDIPRNSFVSLSVYNTLGKEVDKLVSEDLTTGSYEYVWDASKIASGIYFYRISTKEFSDTKRMMLIK